MTAGKLISLDFTAKESQFAFSMANLEGLGFNIKTHRASLYLSKIEFFEALVHVANFHNASELGLEDGAWLSEKLAVVVAKLFACMKGDSRDRWRNYFDTEEDSKLLKMIRSSKRSPLKLPDRLLYKIN